MPDWFTEQLIEGRAAAVAAEEPQPFNFGNGTTLEIAPYGFGRYPFRLSHAHGLIGINPDSRLPPLRIQPWGEFLHGVGPLEAVKWFFDVLEWRLGKIELWVNRVDLHADFQGWHFNANDRDRFVCRARARTTYEDGGQWTGFGFGLRKSKSISARVYDKTEELKHSRAGYWEDIWGPRYVQGAPVVRVEFELARGGLSSFGLSKPEEVIEAAGALWMHLTSNWLTFRDSTDDETRSRWPVSVDWEQIQRASISRDAQGLERMVAGRRRATLQGLAPALVGYLASYGALLGTEDISDTCSTIPLLLRQYGAESGVKFAERVAIKAKGL
jgi:hypothetical protein